MSDLLIRPLIQSFLSPAQRHELAHRMLYCSFPLNQVSLMRVYMENRRRRFFYWERDFKTTVIIEGGGAVRMNTAFLLTKANCSL